MADLAGNRKVMKKIIIFSLFSCSIAQLIAMDPNKIEKEGKPTHSTSEEESISIQDAGILPLHIKLK